MSRDDSPETLEELRRVSASDVFVSGRPRAKAFTLADCRDGGVELLVIDVSVLVLRCSFTRSVDELAVRTLDYDVAVDWVPMHFGGERPRLWCTEPDCGRSGWSLYLDFGQLVCRHCVQLQYASQKTPSSERPRERSLALRRRLGGRPDFGGPMSKRPKGMHRVTYERLTDQIRALEDRYEQDTFPRGRSTRSLREATMALLIERSANRGRGTG